MQLVCVLYFFILLCIYLCFVVRVFASVCWKYTLFSDIWSAECDIAKFNLVIRNEIFKLLNLFLVFLFHFAYKSLFWCIVRDINFCQYCLSCLFFEEKKWCSFFLFQWLFGFNLPTTGLLTKLENCLYLLLFCVMYAPLDALMLNGMYKYDD